MTCDEAKVLLHGLIDGELDMASARAVEAHVASCQRCAAELRRFREMHQAMACANLRFAAPAALRSRIEAAIFRAGCAVRRSHRGAPPARLCVWHGASAAAAASVVFFVTRSGEDERLLGDVVSAHRRSLQAEHLADVRSADQQVVRPWFSGKLAVVPPVIDLAAQGFTLVGGRLDTIDGKPVAAIVYRRGVHIINLFVGAAASRSHGGTSVRLCKASTRSAGVIRAFASLRSATWALTNCATSISSSKPACAPALELQTGV